MPEAQDTLGILVEATSSLLGPLELEEALQGVAESVLEVTPATRASVRILDRSGTKVLGGALGGEQDSDETMTLESGLELLGQVVEERKAVRLPAEEGEGESVAQLGVPLLSGGQVVGVLAASAPSGTSFSAEDERAAVLLAACGGPVIDRLRLERFALTDEGTLAYNDRYLDPRLQQEASRSQRYGHPLSILLMDLDHFRQVNEVHGRVAGDVVLQRFADRVRASVRLSDVLVRSGGEEFVLIATNTELASAATVAERIRKRLADTPILQDKHGTAITQTVSIAIACWDGAESLQDFLTRASEAVRRATKLGGDRVVTAQSDGSAPPPEAVEE